MADDAFFRAGGLASGLDTNAIVDGLTKLEQRPLEMLRKQQAGFQSRVSVLGRLVTKIATLQAAAKALADNGTLGVKATSTNTDFSVTPTSKATAGSYSVSVQGLASSAQKRSAAFAGDSAAVTGGSLAVSVQGVSYGSVTISDGEALSDVAADIRALGAPISATVVNDGTNSYLSVTNQNTGFSGADATTALQLTESYTGSAGQHLTLATTHAATNAAFTIDGLAFTRQSNNVTDAVNGVTLSLKAQTNTIEKLTLDYDAAATAASMQKYVDAYNDIAKTVQGQLSFGGANSDRGSTLAGDSSLRSLLAGLQGIVTSTVSGGATVRTMADLGLKTNFQDGTLSIDTAKLTSAIAANAAAVNNIFSQSTTGVGALTKTLSDQYTNVVDGLFTSRSKNLTSTISRMDKDADRMQLRVDAFKKNLILQFSAMEQVVSGLKSVGNFLNAQQSQKSS
jgi:flagellar hook-associated protein 2